MIKGGICGVATVGNAFHEMLTGVLYVCIDWILHHRSLLKQDVI